MASTHDLEQLLLELEWASAHVGDDTAQAPSVRAENFRQLGESDPMALLKLFTVAISVAVHRLTALREGFLDELVGCALEGLSMVHLKHELVREIARHRHGSPASASAPRRVGLGPPLPICITSFPGNDLRC